MSDSRIRIEPTRKVSPSMTRVGPVMSARAALAETTTAMSAPPVLDLTICSDDKTQVPFHGSVLATRKPKRLAYRFPGSLL